MKRMISNAMAAAALIAVSACSTFNTDPDSLTRYVQEAKMGYGVFCAVQTHARLCTPASQKRVDAGAALALSGIDTYADVLAHGGDWHVALAHTQELVANLVTIIGDIEAGKG
jgi:hypothetical protein